ncbi:MAG: enoyl-CoA hydratase [Chloroflexi bacterium]|nr:MAG: enoyl-CoA hydratase [Chloroflexota bacterium]
MAHSDVVGYEVHGAVALITIQRPEKLNAINKQVALDLQAAWQRFEASEERVAVLTGAGERAFSAGADINDLPELWRAMPGIGAPVEKPVIAATNGHCIGGAVVLVQLCDLCIAAQGTRFSYPEARMGFTGGMIAGLAGRIPHKVAMEMMLMARPMTAARAYEVGFVNAVVPDGAQVETALAWAAEMAEYAPLVLRTLKRFVNNDVLPKGPSERMALALRDLGVVQSSEDIEEGRAAFREKRPPRYKGR